MKNNNNKGCFSGILGTVFVILGVAVYAVLSSLICRALVGLRFGDSSACALLTLSVTGLTVAFVLYEIIFIVWQVKLTKAASGKDAEADKMSKIFRFVFICCICLSLLFSVISANTFTCLREDSISKVFFVTAKEYRWDERNDVLRYTFSCDNNGGLAYKVTMKDGEVIEILGQVTSFSDGFREKYDTDNVNMLSYVADLSEQFDNSEYIIEKRIVGIENMEKVYKDNSIIWNEIQRIIASELDIPE